MTMMIDDAQLIRSFKSGDHDAFVTVVGEYRAELMRHAQRKVHDEAAAEDIVQETFFRAYRAFDRLPDDSRVRPWLHQIAANVCVDEANRRRREVEKTQRSAGESSPRTVADVEQQLGLDIDTTSLRVALADLPDTQRDALTMRFVDELDYHEIAEHEGVSELNARARVSRARSAMRRALHGVAVIPLTIYFMLRRPARGALAAPPANAPANASAAMAASNTVGSAGGMAATMPSAIDAANSIAMTAPTAVPILTKAAVGVGAVAMAFSASPEQPIERPPVVTVEAVVASADAQQALAAPIVVETPASVPPAGAAAPVATPAPVVAAAPVAATVPVTTVPATTVPPTTVPPTTAPATTTPATTAPVASTVPAPPVVVSVPATTVPAPSTVAPTTVPTSTVPPTTLPPLTGGSLSGSVSAVPAGPRLDLSGQASLNVGGTSSSGSLSGRIAVDAPDPAGSRRVDGTLTLGLGNGTVELRIAGYGTGQAGADVATAAGATPTSLSLSGMYRASGATGQLASSGSFSGSLAGGTLSLTFRP